MVDELYQMANNWMPTCIIMDRPPNWCWRKGQAGLSGGCVDGLNGQRPPHPGCCKMASSVAAGSPPPMTIGYHSGHVRHQQHHDRRRGARLRRRRLHARTHAYFRPGRRRHERHDTGMARTRSAGVADKAAVAAASTTWRWQTRAGQRAVPIKVGQHRGHRRQAGRRWTCRRRRRYSNGKIVYAHRPRHPRRPLPTCPAKEAFIAMATTTTRCRPGRAARAPMPYWGTATRPQAAKIISRDLSSRDAACRRCAACRRRRTGGYRIEDTGDWSRASGTAGTIRLEHRRRLAGCSTRLRDRGAWSAGADLLVLDTITPGITDEGLNALVATARAWACADKGVSSARSTWDSMDSLRKGDIQGGRDDERRHDLDVPPTSHGDGAYLRRAAVAPT